MARTRRKSSSSFVALVAAIVSTACARNAPTHAVAVEGTSSSSASSIASSIASSVASSIGSSIAPSSSTAPVASATPKLEGEPLVPLVVEGHGDAVVSLPLGATSARPLVVAVHGNYDRPEWQCGVWRAIVADRAFVLCPRGIARKDSPSADDVRFTFESGVAMAKELDDDIAALHARFAWFVDDGPILYTGFSLGAITGVAYLLRDPSKTPRAVLVEGSYDRWTPAAVASFAKHGGARVLFACGQPSCRSLAAWPAKALENKGVSSKVVLGAGVGHGYDGAVAEAIADAFDWLVEGDARFAAP